MTAESVRELIEKRADIIRRQYGVRELTLFGSTARNETNQSSDVDLLVAFEGKATFDGYMDLKFYLEELLGTAIDLVTDKSLHPRLQTSIAREAIRVA